MPVRDRLTRLRMAGLAASAGLAVGAYGAGALPAGDTSAALLAGTAPWSYWLGLTAWFAGLAVLAGAWWRLGVLVRRRPESVPLGWLLRTGLLWAAPLLVAPLTGSRDGYAYACQGALWLDGVDPYAVGVAPGGCVWTDAVSALWRDTPTPYGPVAVALSGGAVALARLVTTDTDAQLLIVIALLRAGVLAGGALVAVCLPRLARACGVDPVQATWLGLLSPLFMIHAVAGAHNDAVMLGLVLAALALTTTAPPSRHGRHPTAAHPDRRTAAERHGRAAHHPGQHGSRPAALHPVRLPVAVRHGWLPVTVGAVLGLAVAVKVTAIVAVPFAVLLGVVRSRWAGGDRALAGGVLATGAAVGGGGVLAFAGVSLATRLDLGWIGALTDTGRLVQWTSLPTGVGMAAGYALRLAGRPEAVDGAIAAARLLGLVALAAILGVLLAYAWRVASIPDLAAARRRLMATAGLAFTFLALLSPIFYPWYGLTAVAVLAAGLPDRRWVGRLAGLVVLLSFLVLPGGLGLAVVTKLPGALFDVALLATLAVLTYRRWRVRGGRPGDHGSGDGGPRCRGSGSGDHQ